MPAPPPVSTRTDLDSLDRLVTAKKADFVEELDADLLEDDDEGSGVQKTQAFRREDMPMQQHVPVPIVSPVPAAVQPMYVAPSQAPRAVPPDPRKIVAQQKEMARQQELARQAEIARQQEMARQAEIARQQYEAQQAELARQQEAARQAEIARQQEMARQAEIARQEEIVRANERARHEEVAREFERHEQEIARQKAEIAREQAELARQQEIARQQQELARAQQEIARQKEELARQQEIARQQDLARQQALARQAEELARQQQLAREAERIREQEAAKAAASPSAKRDSVVVTPRDADPMSVSQMKAATMSAPPVTRAPETPAMATPQIPPPAGVPEDLSQTVQGIPAPLIPEAPKTSPVLDGADADDKTIQKPTARTLQSAQASPVKITEAADAEEAKHFTQPFRRPSSIAPVAIDIQPPRTGTQQSPVATMQIPRMDARRADTVITRMPPKENHTPWIIAACVAGVFLLGGGITAAVALATSSSAPAAASASADDDADGQRNARTPESTGAKSAPPVAPSIGSHGDKVPEPPTEPVSVNSLPSSPSAKTAKHDSSSTSSPTPSSASHGSSNSSSSASSPNSKVIVPAPAATPAPSPSPSVASNTAPAAPAAPAAAPKAAAAPSGNGVIQVKPPLVVIVVDGQHRRAVNGEVVVTCGAHKVRAGMDTQVVNVPCGGSVAL